MSNPKQGQHKLSEASAIIGNYIQSFGANEILMESRSPLQKMASVGLREKLAEYSITTIEEAIGAARADRTALAQVVGSDVARELASDLFLQRMSQNNSILRELAQFQRQRFAFGARKDIPDREPVIDSTFSSPNVSLAATVNLIANNCMPPIRDQGQRWTCVAFATCAVVEFARCRAFATAPLRAGNDDLSEQFQYWNCKNYESTHGGSYSTQGTWPEISYPLTVADGICREDVWPYDMTRDPSQNDSHVLGAQRDAALRKVSRAVQIGDHRNVSTMKKWLTDNHLVGIAIPVYDSWEESPVVRATGNITLPLPGETTENGHALALVGYEDNPEFAGGGFFIIRNSWGTQWGPNCPFGAGYGTLPYRYLEQENMSAFIVEA